MKYTIYFASEYEREIEKKPFITVVLEAETPEQVLKIAEMAFDLAGWKDKPK